jgi:hypothetical protein
MILKDKKLIKKMIKSSKDTEETVKESRAGFKKGMIRTLNDLRNHK